MISSEIVVSGIGIVSPLGRGREETWRRLLAGESGIRPSQAGLEAVVTGVSANGARSRAGDFAILAAEEALSHAGLSPDSSEIGCAIGQSKPLLDDPSLVLASFTGWSLERVVKAHLQLTGPSANVAAACATGVAAIETAAAWIRSGVCGAALAGASESSLTPFYRAGFEQMGVLARNVSDVRPFDLKRRGFVMGEGAAVLLIESLDHCRRRGGTPMARLASVALRQSCSDPVRFDDDGAAVARLIEAVTVGSGAPDYVNAHGTGTVLNDAVESRGLRRAFGRRPDVCVGSTKASTGHLLGAAGAIEAAFSVLALRDGVMPPSLNIDEPDPLCALPLVRETCRAGVGLTLSLSYGFGGQMGAVLFEAM